MKKNMLILFLAIPLFAQLTPVKVAEIEYQALPFSVRTENSGIYAISTFTVSNNKISIVTSDRDEKYDIQNDGSLKSQSDSDRKNREVFSAESLHHDGHSLADDRNGSYSDASGKRLSLRTIGRNSLTISSNLSGLQKEIRLPFSGDLAYAELIGIDTSGNHFLLIERYLSEMPLKIQREVLTLDADGNRLSTLEIPNIKYLSTDKDFRIDAEGKLYHMMTTVDRMIIFCWSDLTVYHNEPIRYSSEYSYSLHYNSFVTTDESPGESVQQPTAIASRTLALRIGESYAMHKYVCATTNLSSSDVTAPDGDVVRTPPWLLSGTNARIPYMWGGFSSITQFDAGLKSGKFAGDINTSGVSSYSVGVDCSGFVSRCWQMTYHSSTSMMPSITTQYTSWDSLKPGDAIHKVGHVRLFIERSANGGFRVVESAGRNWDVSYWTFAPSDLQGVYTPRFYNSMEPNFSFQRPVLTRVITNGGNNAALTWNCDTTGLLGYRIYTSVDGTLWNLLKNESTVGKVSGIVVPMTNDAEFYRITSVKNDAAKTESDWSNAMGASRTRGASHYLIVDGLERLTASWQSSAHTFAIRYGSAVKRAGVTFSTMKNFLSTIDSPAFNNYDGVIWFLGDEGTAQETFSAQEQALLKSYLKDGKKLFVTGSEIGWDLSQNGTATDKEFYSDYLKATYKTDNALSSTVNGVADGFYSGAAFTIGQVYVEDSPDEIDAVNGSTVCLRYGNNKAAGIQYAGTFGTSQTPGKIIYLSFALETASNDTTVRAVIKNAIDYLEGGSTAVLLRNDHNTFQFQLQQNYPNPFNPSTVISYQLSMTNHVSLKVYDAIGREIVILVNETEEAGSYSVKFDGSKLSTGIYFTRLQSGEKIQIKKMTLLK